MLQTLLFSTTDRNCRPTWHTFQPEGRNSVHHTQYTYTVHTFSWPLWVLWQNLRPGAHNQEKPHTIPSSIYLHVIAFVQVELAGVPSEPAVECAVQEGGGQEQALLPLQPRGPGAQHCHQAGVWRGEWAESIEWFIEVQAFSLLIDLAPLPTHCNTVDCGGREYWLIYRGPGFLAFVWFGSSPNTHSWVDYGAESIEWFIEEKAVVWFGSFTIPPWSRHRGRLRKRENFLTGEGGRVGRGAKSYDSKKAWFSLNRSILSGWGAKG
jgi:hypothetical protein